MSCLDSGYAAQVALANHETQESIIQNLDTLCDTLSYISSSQAVVDCDKLSTMPDITFTIEGRDYTLTADQYVLKVIGGSISLAGPRPAVQ